MIDTLFQKSYFRSEAERFNQCHAPFVIFQKSRFLPPSQKPFLPAHFFQSSSLKMGFKRTINSPFVLDDGMLPAVAANRSFSLGAILLAAGNSSRMGRPKMLLPWHETTVLGHLIALWTDLASQVAVVHAAADAAIEAELDRLQFPMRNRIINPDPGRGMFSSIQCAACWTGRKPELTHWAIALGDQPHLRRSSLDAVVDFAKSRHGKICQPSRGGSARHPVILPKHAFEKLGASTEENLKQFLQLLATEVSLIELDDPGLDLDIDHPADYTKALQLSARK